MQTLKQIWKEGKKPFLALLALFAAFLILTPVWTYLYFSQSLTSKTTIMNGNNNGIVLLDRSGKAFFSFYNANDKKIVPLSAIPTYMQDAVIASEDKNFYHEPGFSLQSMARALLADIKSQQLDYGASTITQQLVRAALLNPQKTFLRKYQEIILAYEVEQKYSKDDILEMYLNTIYFGEGAFGIESASQAYFGKSARDLTIAESALLTAILPAPSAFSPLSGDAAAARARQIIVLQKMKDQGYITAAEQQLALDQQLIYHPQKETLNLTAPHFALMVRDELIKKYGEQAVAHSGYRVTTTLNLDWQKYAQTVVKNQMSYLQYNKATNGAAVAMDPRTGEIWALVGSIDWANPQFGTVNMAVAPRQPGSSFKPLIYSDAIENKLITAATPLDDKPISYGTYTPLDYDHNFRGIVLARRALANSLNIPAVEVMDKVGVTNGITWAQKLGISTLEPNHDYGLPLVLGAAEVPLTQMTAAYATFANSGNYNPPTTILQIQDKAGNTIYTYTPSPQSVMSPETSFIISSILSDNTARAEEFGGALTISRTAAVKTGTTNDFRDALTIGYTPSLALGVWVGNNDNKAMDNIAGSLGAAPIWRLLMEHFLAGTPAEQFVQPSDVDKTLVCRSDGQLSHTEATESAYMEFFLQGTVPNTYCDQVSGTPTPTLPSENPTPSLAPNETPTPTIEQILPSTIVTP